MNRREQLEENYADSLFTLLMDHVAEVQGNQALEENRRLREDPDAEVPQEVRRACLKAINRAFRKKNISEGRVSAVAWPRQHHKISVYFSGK